MNTMTAHKRNPWAKAEAKLVDAELEDLLRSAIGTPEAPPSVEDTVHFQKQATRPDTLKNRLNCFPDSPTLLRMEDQITAIEAAHPEVNQHRIRVAMYYKRGRKGAYPEPGPVPRAIHCLRSRAYRIITLQAEIKAAQQPGYVPDTLPPLTKPIGPRA